jgi:hypothetical protein
MRTLVVTDPDRHRRRRNEADLRIIELGLDQELADARRATAIWLARLVAADEPAGPRGHGRAAGLAMEDQVRIRGSLDDALMAVILGEALTFEESRALLGGWDDLVVRRR